MKPLVLFFLICIISGCKAGKKTINNASPLGDEWTMETIPNNLDKIGTIFAIRGRQKQYIASINLDTTGSPAILPANKFTRKISAGAFINFLNVQGLDSLSLEVGDTAKLSTNFEVQNARYIRQNGDILEAFESKANKKQIINNLNAYDLASVGRVYLVTEILKSPDVDISISRFSSPRIKLNFMISKLLSANPNLSIEKNDSTKLKYRLGEPLIIFYKLNPINLNVIKGRSPGMKDSVGAIQLSPKSVTVQELQ